eukprot:25956_1
MNINAGGKQAILKDGYFIKRTRRRSRFGRGGGVFEQKIIHKMVDEQGVSKGIRNVLEERGIKTSGIYGDDLRNMLSEQQDFKEDKKWTRLILKVNELGGDGAYAPKYHPELQIPIEQGWCDAKKKFKDMQDFKSKRQRKWWNESIIV